MRPSPVEIVVDVFSKDLAKLSLAENDNMIETLSPYAAEETFADRVQVWRARWDRYDIDVRPAGYGGERSPKLAIVVSNKEPWRNAKRRRLSQLLRSPGICRTTSHIEVNDFPCAMNHKEEHEDRPDQYIMELEEIAGPRIAAVIRDEPFHV